MCFKWLGNGNSISSQLIINRYSVGSQFVFNIESVSSQCAIQAIVNSY